MADFVPRLWATRKIGALLDRVRVEGEAPALVEEISGLGLGYGLVTPYTTLVIAGQEAGAASWANMSLYGQQDLNRVSGATTVQARVQNQAYQQATQGNLASGANVLNRGNLSLAQVNDLSVDLNLLQGQAVPNEPVTMEWLAHNVGIDRNVAFGSSEYFSLAADPEVRPFLETSANVVFRYQDEVIAVQVGSEEQGHGGMGLWEWVRVAIWEALGW